MLLRFQVKNFKQFKDLTLNFERVRDYAINPDCLTPQKEALKTLLVYGENASGKSNLGFAIFDIVHHLFDKVTVPEAYQYYLNADAPEQPAYFSYKFKLGDDYIRYEYEKEEYKKLVSEALFINEQLVFLWNKSTRDFSSLSKWNLDKLNNQFNDNISFLRYAANNSNLEKDSPITRLMQFVNSMLWFRRADSGNNFIGLHAQPDNIARYFIDHNLVKGFEDFLNQHGVKEELEAIVNPDGSPDIYIKHKRKLPFFSTASSGTSALAILFYWKNFFKQTSFVFIDEFDAFYHAKVAEDIFCLLKTLPQQVIATTHNTNLLDQRHTRADCCFSVRNGTIRSLSDRTEREIRAGNNLEKLYRAGEFDD